DGARYRQVMAEALGQAFVDNFPFAGDPIHIPPPLDGLASKVYAADRAAAIALDKARATIAPGDPWAFQAQSGPPHGASPPAPFEGTTQICAADADGNVATLITSIGSSFGSLVVVPDTGIILGNAMQWFDPHPGRITPVGPGRMPLYASPVLLAFRDGVAVGAVGASGGYRIPTGVLHVFANIADHGMSAQEAVEHPRVHCQGGAVDVD